MQMNEDRLRALLGAIHRESEATRRRQAAAVEEALRDARAQLAAKGLSLPVVDLHALQFAEASALMGRAAAGFAAAVTPHLRNIAAAFEAMEGPLLLACVSERARPAFALQLEYDLWRAARGLNPDPAQRRWLAHAQAEADAWGLMALTVGMEGA